MNFAVCMTEKTLLEDILHFDSFPKPDLNVNIYLMCEEVCIIRSRPGLSNMFCMVGSGNSDFLVISEVDRPRAVQKNRGTCMMKIGIISLLVIHHKKQEISVGLILTLTLRYSYLHTNCYLFAIIS